MSLLGARSLIKARPPILEETVPTQKQLGDGGLGNRKLLNAAPEEVVNPTKETRFIVDEGGNVKDVSTGRGNLNKIGKQGPIEIETTIDNVRVGVEETFQEHIEAIKEIAPDAKIGYRGSLARGTKGANKGNAPFDPTNFDVDGFIVSNKLASQIRPNFKGQRWASESKPIKTIQESIHPKLKSLFPGMRQGRGKNFGFRIFTEEQMQNWDKAKDPFTIIEEAK